MTCQCVACETPRSPRHVAVFDLSFLPEIRRFTRQFRHIKSQQLRDFKSRQIRDHGNIEILNLSNWEILNHIKLEIHWAGTAAPIDSLGLSASRQYCWLLGLFLHLQIPSIGNCYCSDCPTTATGKTSQKKLSEQQKTPQKTISRAWYSRIVPHTAGYFCNRKFWN